MYSLNSSPPILVLFSALFIILMMELLLLLLKLSHDFYNFYSMQGPDKKFCGQIMTQYCSKSHIIDCLILSQLLVGNQVCVLNHPPYSSDLTPCDLNKKRLEWGNLGTVSDIIGAPLKELSRTKTPIHNKLFL